MGVALAIEPVIIQSGFLLHSSFILLRTEKTVPLLQMEMQTKCNATKHKKKINSESEGKHGAL